MKQLEVIDGEELLRSLSVYEMIKQKKHALTDVSAKQSAFREEIRDFASLQRRLLADRQTRESIEVLTKQAPRDVQALLASIQSSSSEYLNLAELERVLKARDYEKLRSSATIIDRQRMFGDLRKKAGEPKLQSFLSSYMNTPLDVVSLAEARETVAQAPTSSLFDERLQAQITQVLDFAEEQLKYVPHARREQISLGDFLARHTYTGGSTSQSSQQYMADVLRNKLQQVIGDSIDQAATIDWEFGGFRTNPLTHKQEDARVKAALAQGKGYNAEATLDAQIESQLGGRLSQELGEAALVGYMNGTEHAVQERSAYELEQLLRDAQRLTALRPEFTHTKSMYENEIMKLYSSPEFDQAAVERAVQAYTEVRLRDCLLDDEFKAKASSNNGHYYMKMLKEQIAEELAIAQPAKASDFAFSKLMEGDIYKANPEGRYNTAAVSNLENIGYDKLVNDKHTQSTLDKLLGDYFLQKRGQYVASNQLLDQLNKQFGGVQAQQYPDGHPLKTKDSHQVNVDAYPTSEEPNLAYAYFKNQVGKEANPKIKPQDYTEMMELDIAAARALQDGKNGIAADLCGQDLPAELTSIPEYFSMFDVRKPAKQYVDDKLGDLLQEIFEVRRKVEKTLTRNELLAYDRMLSAHLTKEVLLPRLKDACETDRNTLLQLR